METIVAEAITSDRLERHRIVDDGKGMGGGLCPPGHVNLRYTYEVWKRRSPRGRWRDEASSASVIGYALDGRWETPDAVQASVRELIAGQPLVYSEQWMRQVYGFYARCYFPSGVISGERSERTGTPEQHGGYLKVRQYFPDHEPRVDLIESGGDYGAWVCQVCGCYVQYEPSVDGFSVSGQRTTVCVGDQPHQREA